MPLIYLGNILITYFSTETTSGEKAEWILTDTGFQHGNCWAAEAEPPALAGGTAADLDCSTSVHARPAKGRHNAC